MTEMPDQLAADIKQACAVIRHYVFVPVEAKAAEINALLARLEANLPP